MVSAVLLLEALHPIDFEILEQRIGRAIGLNAEFTHQDKDDGHTIVVVDGDLLITMGLPAPYPENLSNLTKFAHWWPDAMRDISRNKAHLFVTCRWSKNSRFEAHIRHAIFVRELVEQLPVIGVLWGSVLTPAENFKGEIQSLMNGQVPILLWVLIQYSRQPNGNTLISTLGMRDFGHMEIETESSRPMQESYDIVRNVATYVVSNDKRLADGDTVGANEQERIKVRHVRSFRPDVNDQVYWLELRDKPSVKKPKGFFSSMFGTDKQH